MMYVSRYEGRDTNAKGEKEERRQSVAGDEENERLEGGKKRGERERLPMRMKKRNGAAE